MKKKHVEVSLLPQERLLHPLRFNENSYNNSKNVVDDNNSDCV